MRTSLVALLVLSVPSVSTNAEEIPLASVWGHVIGGTQKMRPLDPDSDDVPYYGKPDTRSDYWKMVRALRQPSSEGITTFVVKGEPLEALRSASRVLQGIEEPAQEFQAGDRLSAVFFARLGPTYVGLERISVDREGVTIVYDQQSHQTMDATEHLALIPLGEQAPGLKKVNVVAGQTVDEQGRRDDRVRAISGRISGASEFEVKPLKEKP